MSIKPFEIPKQIVWEAWKLVRANKGAGGIDGQTIADFESNLKNNLFRLWNKLSSGSYFPPAVRGVTIPKSNGGSRLLGIPTITDRVAQMVVKLQIEARLEQVFLEDSFGYRPGKSAHDAIEVTRKRCWQYKWLLEFDIKAMFDKIPHDLMMKAVLKHVPEVWCNLYISRWLKAEMQLAEDEKISRAEGTPQGGVISPILANLFMHYAFDIWMKQNFPANKFCRYADDGIVHCYSKAQAEHIKEALSKRLQACGLEMHPQKTKIVYLGKDASIRKQNTTAFTFLGFCFRNRGAKNRKTGKIFECLLPAVSDKALKNMRKTIKWEWKIRLRSDLTLEQIAKFINPTVRGWFVYYGRFYASDMRKIALYINEELVKWASRSFRMRHRHKTKLFDILRDEFQKRPKLFVHWEYFKVY